MILTKLKRTLKKEERRHLDQNKDLQQEQNKNVNCWLLSWVQKAGSASKLEKV